MGNMSVEYVYEKRGNLYIYIYISIHVYTYVKKICCIYKSCMTFVHIYNYIHIMELVS